MLILIGAHTLTISNYALNGSVPRRLPGVTGPFIPKIRALCKKGLAEDWLFNSYIKSYSWVS